MRKIKIGNIEVSRLIIGANPFSGFSHQTPQKDLEMKKYYTVAKIKETLKKAETLGITTHISRADHHVIRYLMEYWDEGGKVQWIAQTCPELGEVEHAIRNAIAGDAKGCFIHGGTMEYLLAQGKIGCVPDLIKIIKDAGLAAGVAGHNPKIFEWAEKNIDADFYMCAHYNPSNREKVARHVTGCDERFHDEDRQKMIETINKIKRPIIHYKVLAAGRSDPEKTFEFLSKVVKFNHAVCLGIYTKDKASMIEENVKLAEKYLKN